MPHRIYRAAWVLPIDAPPIRDGWVEVDRGRDRRCRRRRRAANREPPNPNAEPPNAEPRIVILPGLVNAHTHLELSWMRGRVPPGDAMPAWAARLIGER